jgi:hypothetical protein
MADKPHRIFPHDDFESHAPGLWSVRGSLPIPLKRNMTVYRLADGTLLLHSVVALDDAGMGKLDALGRPSVIVVPHGGHRMDLTFYKARYPQARVLSPAAVRAKVEEVVAVDATCEEALPALGVRLHPVPGFKNGELAYEVDIPNGKALIVSDAVANRDHPPGIGGKLMAAVAGGIKGRLGVPRIMRMMMVNDKAAARAGLGKLADVPNVSVLIPAHGRPVLGGCSEALREAAARL